MTPTELERILLLVLRISNDLAVTVDRLQTATRELIAADTRNAALRAEPVGRVDVKGGWPGALQAAADVAGYSSADRNSLPLVRTGQGDFATEWTPTNGGKP